MSSAFSGSFGKKSHRASDRAAAHDQQLILHGSGRRGTSQALIKREPRHADQEPGPSQGYRGRGSRETANEQEINSIGRFRVVKWTDLLPAHWAVLVFKFEMSVPELKYHFDTGKVRWDTMSICKWDFELMYPHFPPDVVQRVRTFNESAARHAQQMKEQRMEGLGRRGGRISDIGLESDHQPYGPAARPQNRGDDMHNAFCQCTMCKQWKREWWQREMWHRERIGQRGL